MSLIDVTFDVEQPGGDSKKGFLFIHLLAPDQGDAGYSASEVIADVGAFRFEGSALTVSLRPNSLDNTPANVDSIYVPPGTAYRATFKTDKGVVAGPVFQVPESGGPYKVRELLVNPPVGLAYGPKADQTALDAEIAARTAADTTEAAARVAGDALAITLAGAQTPSGSKTWTADQIFKSGGPHVDVAGFAGFDPTGATVSTAAMQAAINAATALLRTHQPSGGAEMGSVPTIFVRGGSIVDIDAALTIPVGYFRVVSDGHWILRQRTPTADIWSALDCYMLALQGVEMSGGQRWIAFGNANTNSSQVFLDQCGFASNNGVFGMETIPKSPAVNLSCQFVVSRSKIVNPYQTMKVAPGVYALFEKTWIQTGPNAFNGPQFENRGSLDLNGVVLVPGKNPVNPAGRWVDNLDDGIAGAYGGWFSARGGTRFGGEYGGMPIVRNTAGPVTGSPYVGGGSIILDGCEAYIGPDAGPKYLVHLTGGVLPQLLSVRNCQGLAGVGNIITSDFDIAAYLNALPTDTAELWWANENNVAHPALDDGGRIPAALFQSPHKLHWSAGSPVPWIAMSLTSPWVVHAAGFRSPRYRRIADRAEVEVVVRASSATTANITTLPPGFAPLEVVMEQATGVGTSVPLYIGADGAVGFGGISIPAGSVIGFSVSYSVV